MTPPARPVLTDTELAVLAGAAEGDTYAVIGARLGLHEKSVAKIAVRAGRKLGARSITNAVVLACRAGLLDGQRRRHGDHAGYAAHVYRGEDPKDCKYGCWEGEQAYRADRRQARQAREHPSAPASRPRSAPAGPGPSGPESASEAHSPAVRPKNQTKAA